MPHEFALNFAILLRVCACIGACLSFYLAFFMYEDDKGRWQNRIEDLWTRIYDKAKATDTTATAIFNRLAEGLQEMFNRLFGQNLFSIKAVMVSANLSLGVALLAAFVAHQSHPMHEWAHSLENGRIPSRWAGELGGTLREVSEVYLRTLGRMVGSDGSVTKYLLKSLSFVFAGFLFSAARTKLVKMVASLPISYLICMSLLRGLEVIPSGYEGRKGFFILAVGALFLSTIWDFYAIVIVRRFLMNAATVVTIGRMLYVTVVFIAFGCFAFLMPEIVSVLSDFTWRAGAGRDLTTLDDLADLLLLFNVTTLIYCLMPAIALLLILVHRLMWPILGRLLYPVASESLIKNRKVLVSIGSACASYGVAGGKITFDGLLKILK